MMTSAARPDSVQVRASKSQVLPTAYFYRGGMEVTVHRCPRGLQNELDAVFPSQRGSFRESVVIATAGHACVDLVGVGPAVDAEKDALLERVRDVTTRKLRSCWWPVTVL